uniref:Uncharacterized protein n=1 Tax=Steinernema glaseri TaxID=37863 RepID=A0A1I8A723_9BILA
MKSFVASSSSASSNTTKGSRQATKKSGRVRKSSKQKREQGKVLEKLRDMNVLDYIYSLKAQLESDDQMESPELASLISAFRASLSPKQLSPEPSSP